jgi:hypothetical protein
MASLSKSSELRFANFYFLACSGATNRNLGPAETIHQKFVPGALGRILGYGGPFDEFRRLEITNSNSTSRVFGLV